MKTKPHIIITLIAIGLFALIAVCAKKPTTEWVGCPMVSNDDRWAPSQGWIPTIEMGFRSDGVVVWRTRKSSR